MTTEQIIPLEFIQTAFTSEQYFKGQDTHDANVRFIDQIVCYTQDIEWIEVIGLHPQELVA